MSHSTKPPIFGGWGGWKFPGPVESVLLLITYWVKVLAEMASKWFPMLDGEYPRTWFIFEFLMLNLGLTTSLKYYQTELWIPVAGYILGFMVYWAHRNFMPWLFTLCQGVHAFGAGTAVGLIIEFLGTLGLKIPKSIAGGTIIASGEKITRKGGPMNVVREMTPAARRGNYVVPVLGIVALAIVAYMWPASSLNPGLNARGGGAFYAPPYPLFFFTSYFYLIVLAI